MQRRINQVTTSSQTEQKKESQKENSGIHISFKRKDSKRIPFSMIKKGSKKEMKKSAAASIGSTVSQKDKEAEAAKNEGSSTDPAGEEDIGRIRQASPHDRNGGQHKKKTTFIVLQKNTRSLNSSERLEEMFGELHKIDWDAVLISETWRLKQRGMGDTARSHHGRVGEVHQQTWSCDSTE